MADVVALVINFLIHFDPGSIGALETPLNCRIRQLPVDNGQLRSISDKCLKRPVHGWGICRLINEVFVKRPNTLAQIPSLVNPVRAHQVVFIDNFSSLPNIDRVGYHVGMPIQDKELHRLQEIYKSHYGRPLSKADASAMSHRLITLFRALGNRDDLGQRKVRTITTLPNPRRD